MGRFKPPSDPRGGHARLYWSLLDSNAWLCLSANDQRAYVGLLRCLRSTNNGDLSLAFTAAKRIGIKSQTTLASSLRALCAVGLIAVTRKGGRTKSGQGLPTLYRLTDYTVYANPAKHIEAMNITDDWKSIATLGMGREKIRQADELAAKEARLASERKKSHLQIWEATSPKLGVDQSQSNPDNGAWPFKAVQKSEKAAAQRMPRGPATARVYAA